jgi:hypothetical protein
MARDTATDRRCADTRIAWLWILGVGVAARLLMSVSGLIQENDCYRYVLDGEAILHGVNPFRFSPEQVAEAGEASFGGGGDAQLILSRVGYPDIPTIYPPLAQLAFTVGAFLTPWSWHGQRIVFLLADLGTIAVLVLLLSRLGRPRHWIVFYAWNPLIIKEIANSAHLESLLSLSLSLLVLRCCYWQARPTVARLAWVALAFSAAILSKLYPIILAPILAVYVWRTARAVRPVLALGAMCLVTGVSSVVVKAVEHAVVIGVLLVESVLLWRGQSLLGLADEAETLDGPAGGGCTSRAARGAADTCQ